MTIGQQLLFFALLSNRLVVTAVIETDPRTRFFYNSGNVGPLIDRLI